MQDPLFICPFDSYDINDQRDSSCFMELIKQVEEEL